MEVGEGSAPNPDRAPEVEDATKGKTQALLEFGDYLPWIKVRINGIEHKFLVDTGTDVNVMSHEMAKRSGVKPVTIMSPLMVRFLQGTSTIGTKAFSFPTEVAGI
ncbi:hypothetical protein R1flu_002896 [Riccia fluitans]|uniref:Peptidase A2 domain-containing protein n=1 Tax=Riccia fluitans TaxID=41844 RepID=A0ABD1Y7I2_9MARC